MEENIKVNMEDVQDILNEKGVKNPCPMCNEKEFVILKGYVNNNIEKQSATCIKSIACVCTNCGYIMQFMLPFLDLFTRDELDEFEKELTMKKDVKDLNKAIKREKTFSTEAKEEGKGALKREKEEKKKGLKESAKDSEWETKVDNKFANIRKEKVKKLEKKLPKKDKKS